MYFRGSFRYVAPRQYIMTVKKSVLRYFLEIWL